MDSSRAESLDHLIRYVKRRMKDPGHLKDKLIRKLKKAQEAGKAFDITTEDLFTQITDLDGRYFACTQGKWMGSTRPCSKS